MTAKIKCPYKYSARSRQAKIDFICGIGGYRGRGERWPIEFNVSLGSADISFDHLWATYRKEYANQHPDEEVGEFKRVTQIAYDRIGSNALWERAQEDCQRDLSVEWTDTYYQLWDGTPIRTELALRGRCGKHLVLHNFESLILSGMDEDELRESLMSQSDEEGTDIATESRLRRGFSWYYSNEFIDRFYRYCVQCVEDFTPEKASLNLENYAASNLFSDAEMDYAEYVKEKEDHDAIVGCAQTLRRYLAEREGAAVLQMLRTLSRAAGVSEEELW